MEIKGIILRTTDLERSTAFWSKVVGLALTGEVPGYAFLDGGSVSLTLSMIDSLPFDEALTENVFDAADVRETYQAMADHGVPFEGELGPPIMSKDGQDLVGASFRDPDGHYGLLSGWVPSVKAKSGERPSRDTPTPWPTRGGVAGSSLAEAQAQQGPNRRWTGAAGLSRSRCCRLPWPRSSHSLPGS